MAKRVPYIGWPKKHPCRHAHLGVLKRNADGRCAVCIRERNKRKYARNPEKHREFARLDRLKNPLTRRIHDGCVFSPGQTFDSMLSAQNFMCGNPACPTDLRLIDPRRRHVDHDHAIVGRPNVRSILCSKCNHAIGLLDDSALRAAGVVEYLFSAKRRLTDAV